MIIARHFQRHALMIRSHFFGRDVPFNRENIDIRMRHRMPALSQLLRQGKEKRVGSEIVEENFQILISSAV